jgi:arginine decarboxylase
MKDTADQVYNIQHWSDGFFRTSGEGHLLACPRGSDDVSVDLRQLVGQFHENSLSLPVLVRFTDILHERLRRLCGAFDEAIATSHYSGSYTAVYPIKVNQQRHVVETILAHDPERVGLEAGSKPELMTVLALSANEGGVIVCNGYKDREYIRLALIGQRLGMRVYLVVEKLSELALIIEEARNLGVQPLIGLRVRLASIASGNWQNTGGEKGKFGLSAAEIIRAVDYLRNNDMLSSLRMLHFHMGSQIPNIRDVQKAMGECSRYYAELCSLGAVLECVNVGGGLGIDYEGTRSRSDCSINYSLQEYANRIVHALQDICEQHDLPHPHIITESGRAITAHHAVLITNVIEVASRQNDTEAEAPAEDAPPVLHDLWDALQELDSRSALEVYHEVVHSFTEAQTMFSHGELNLEQRAHAEQLYYAICIRLQELLNPANRQQRVVLDDLNDKLADKYFCNFSLFQSIPDAWAISQVFPVVPLQRLNEIPERRGIIEDVTCDSDGRLKKYVDNQGIENNLPLHGVLPGENYLIGIFLVGAYQETLGDIHNLFGDTDSVNVVLNENGSYTLQEASNGETVDQVLRHVRFDAKGLLTRLQHKLDALSLDNSEHDALLAELEAGLQGYTYLED